MFVEFEKLGKFMNFDDSCLLFPHWTTKKNSSTNSALKNAAIRINFESWLFMRTKNLEFSLDGCFE